jgi:Zn-dependent peptidase ImmA (M78 family)/DNA-binding XRE family transcriptional regulator
MAEIPVSGAVLKWAREFRGLSLSEAAERLGLSVTELHAFETEAHMPTLTKFKKFGSVYRLPLATLFRRTPPEEPPKPKDFRTFAGMEPKDSFAFRVALSNVRTLQFTLRTLSVDDQNFQGAVLRKYDFEGDAFKQGASEREQIGVTIQQQLSWKSDEGFRRWRAIIENLGIAVYLQKFDESDPLGYSLWEEDIAPAIVINKSVPSDNARVYTLVHEYAHLLVRQPGISDLNRKNPTEVFCNRFAAAFLMPLQGLQTVLPQWPDQPIKWDGQVIRDAARRLKVSAMALAIRLEELNKAPAGLNQMFAAHEKAQKKTDGHPDPIVTKLSELGGRFVASIIGALDRDVIDSIQASEALGLRPARLQDARLYVERQRELASA